MSQVTERPEIFFENDRAEITSVDPESGVVELRIKRRKESIPHRESVTEFKPTGCHLVVGKKVTRNNCYWH